jgi:hypothetical protein
MEHLPEPLPVLHELMRLTGRYLVMTVPYKQTPQKALCPHCLETFPLDGHLHRFDEVSFRAVLESAGFRIIRLDRFFPPTAWETSAVIRWWPRPAREGLRKLLQKMRLVTADNAIFIGALCEVP